MLRTSRKNTEIGVLRRFAPKPPPWSQAPPPGVRPRQVGSDPRRRDSDWRCSARCSAAKWHAWRVPLGHARCRVATSFDLLIRPGRRVRCASIDRYGQMAPPASATWPERHREPPIHADSIRSIDRKIGRGRDTGAEWHTPRVSFGALVPRAVDTARRRRVTSSAGRRRRLRSTGIRSAPPTPLLRARI